MNTKNFEKFSPIDFLKISEEINKYSDILNVNDSSIERTIFGRLYYASFLYAREWLSKNYGYKSKGPADHKNLPYFIKKDTLKNSVLFVFLLIFLFFLFSFVNKLYFWIWASKINIWSGTNILLCKKEKH